MKPKFISNKPTISSEEIAKGKDFNQVLNAYKTTTPIWKKPIFLSSVIVVLASGLSLLLLTQNKPTTENQNIKETTPKKTAIPVATIEEETAFVNPPLKDLNVPYEKYRINAQTAKTINYKTGSTIHIPANCFVDETGQEITGEVEIKYREFHDPVDFFVSGIPMTYDSAGTEYIFESAGMIEVLGFQNGKPVFIKPDKELTVKMASNYSGTHYNLYALDTVNRNWKCEGKDKVIINDSKAEIIEDKIETLDLDIPKNIENKIVEIKKEIKTLKTCKPAPPKKVEEDKYVFNIDVSKEEFPELAEYDNIQWEVGEENTHFDASWYKVNWHSAEIKEIKAGQKYELKLTTVQTSSAKIEASKPVNRTKKRKESGSTNQLNSYKDFTKATASSTVSTASVPDIRKVTVYPVYQGEDFEKAQKVFQDKFNKYKTKLANRLAEEERLKVEYEAALKKIREENEARKEALKEQQRRLKQTASLRQKIYRAFDVQYFGTWNCDSPIPRPRGRTLAANFIDRNNNDLIKNKYYMTVNLVERGKNALFRYDTSRLNKFKFNPKEKNTLWMITSEGKLAIFESKEFSLIPNNTREYTFQMNVLDTDFKTTNDLKEALGI